MSKDMKGIILLVALLVLPALACGNDVTPTKIAEVNEPVVEEADPDDAAESPSAEDSAEETVSNVQEAEEAEDEADEAAAPSGPDLYQVGDVVAMGDVVMAVLGWETPAGDQFFQPEEGKQFVVVDVMLVNQGNRSVSVSSLLQMELKDETEQRYDVDLMASTAAGASGPDGEISPGERVRGKVGFQVPAGAPGLTFIFEPDFWSTGKVFVALGPDPVAVEPPAQVAGETEAELFQVGDVIQLGDLELVVNGVSFSQGKDFFVPDAGNQFVLVDVSITNRGSEAETVSSLLQMWLKDATGQKYDVDIMASSLTGASTPDGDIVAGETLRGQVGYQTPVDVTGLVFVFDADIFGAGKVQVAIPTTP